MEEKLLRLYNECIKEIESIGIDILNYTNIYTNIEIHISKRNNKRYGACKQLEPDKSTRYTKKIRGRRYIKYRKYNRYIIEISPWVMELDNKIIKNTIMHELIHCMPDCTNHGEKFKEYAKYINLKLGYDISRVGNKKEDYQKSNIEYKEETKYKYKIECTKCSQIFYRQRYNKNFTRKYRCGKCGGKFKISKLD